MARRTIITGGTGLIGRALAVDLLAAGDEVVVLTRNPEAARLPQGIEVVRWDGATADGWGDLANGAYAVVNLAGENVGARRWSAARKQAILTSRVQAGAAVLAAIERARDRPKVLVQSSAVGYYGNSGERAVTEDSPAGEDFLAEVCKQWEASTAAVEALGVRRVVIRTGVVLSAAGGALAKMLPLFRLGLAGPLGSGRQYFPWIHIEDEVRAIRFLIETERARGVFNLCSFDPLKNRAFTRALGRVLARPTLLPAPAFALRLALGEMSDMLLGGQRAVPRRLLELGFRFRFPEAEAALRQLLGRPGGSGDHSAEGA